MTIYFDHEKLRVYQDAIQFVSWADDFMQSISRSIAAKDQLDRASTSVPLNIAEGNAKFSIKDRCRFLGIGYGSAVECAACLDVFVAKKLAQPEDIEPGKARLKGIVDMLIGLMTSLSQRVGEEPGEYLVGYEA